MTVRGDIVSAAIWHGVKVSKKDAEYKEGRVNGLHCGVCVYFNPDLSACRIVAGEIAQDDVCRYFKRKFNS